MTGSRRIWGESAILDDPVDGGRLSIGMPAGRRRPVEQQGPAFLFFRRRQRIRRLRHYQTRQYYQTRQCRSKDEEDLSHGGYFFNDRIYVTIVFTSSGFSCGCGVMGVVPQMPLPPEMTFFTRR